MSSESELQKDIAGFYADPLGYVLYAFPWGKPGTSLEDSPGPDTWQTEVLTTLGQRIRGEPLGSFRDATASGHGVGKTALVSWIILWAMSTRPHLAGWVTANTQNQLRGKTWRELGLWHPRAINAHWFVQEATRFYKVGHATTWGIDAIPWSETNSESFAGLHGQHILMLMDEASGIADIIWTVAEGAMTTARALWLVFGNPTRNKGRFRDCFSRMRHRWHTRHVDSRSARMTNKKQIAEWLQDYGEDSDFFRVRVRGEFPKTASNQLISSECVLAARTSKLELPAYVYAPILLGVDVARYGTDESVISVRQGRKHREMIPRRGLNNIALGGLVAEVYRRYHRAGFPMGAVFVDGIGTGTGVVDYLISLGYPVIDVNSGSNAERKDLYYNKRMEMWDRLKEWLTAGASIIDDPTLADQLTRQTYRYLPKTEQMLLNPTEATEESPDRAVSLALTFAEVQFSPQMNDTYSGGALYFEPEVV